MTSKNSRYHETLCERWQQKSWLRQILLSAVALVFDLNESRMSSAY